MLAKDRKRICSTVFISFVVLIFAACAPDKAMQKDAFMDKWSTMAESAQGHSPVPKPKIAVVPQVIAPEEEKGAPGIPAVEKSLPTNPVNLKMRQADVKAVLRSLARAAGLNLLVRNEVKGEVTVDFHDVPWNQAFMSILHSQGLAYVWDGDIISSHRRRNGTGSQVLQYRR